VPGRKRATGAAGPGIEHDYGPEGERFFRLAREELLPKLRETALFLSLFADDPDPKYCMELGMAIALDKPIITVVPRGRTIGEHLRRVSDAVLEDVDFDDPDADRERVQDTIARVLAERGLLT
jgi:hypothetical protein